MARWWGVFKSQAFSGILLLLCTFIALLWANSKGAVHYFALQKLLQHAINDGLMAVFFLLVGLEIKRELVVGELNTFRKALLPVCAAIGGMAVPALLFVAMNWHHPRYLNGWAIPSATDIAFALGVLSLGGSRVPRGLFIFLVALAIIDDLGAILIIALFYSQQLQWLYLALSGVCWLGLWVLNRAGVLRLRYYLLLGFLLWLCMLHSGIHATIAGVLVALTVPVKIDRTRHLNILEIRSPLKRLEHWLHMPVTYGIIPLFVLFNAGIALTDIPLLAAFHNTVFLGVVIGLVVGKCIGIFVMTMLLVKWRWVELPHGLSLRHYFPISLIAGIGFTMSIFIAELAFPVQPLLLVDAKLGILCGSFLAAVLGYTTLQFIIRRK